MQKELLESCSLNKSFAIVQAFYEKYDLLALCFQRVLWNFLIFCLLHYHCLRGNRTIGKNKTKTKYFTSGLILKTFQDKVLRRDSISTAEAVQYSAVLNSLRSTEPTLYGVRGLSPVSVALQKAHALCN